MFHPVIGWSDDIMGPLNGRAKWERGIVNGARDEADTL